MLISKKTTIKKIYKICVYECLTMLVGVRVGEREIIVTKCEWKRARERVHKQCRVVSVS